MKIHRFIGDFDLSQNVVKIHDADIVRQIKNILRLKEGETVILGDGKLKEAKGKIASIKKDSVEVAVQSVAQNQDEPEREVTLYCSILKKDNFDFVVQKATEAGVSAITPVICARTIKQGINLERLRKIAKEAAEQSGRGVVPRINLPLPFDDATEKAKENEINLIFEKGGQSLEAVRGKLVKKKTAGIFIGPEGGWSEDELKIASKNYFLDTTLGRLTLRAETAAVVATWFVAME